MIDTGFLNDILTLAILCTQWGDTAKGKIADLFAMEWADIIARGTGGANTGNTARYRDIEFVFHQLPPGMLSGKPNIIGSGVAIEPCQLLDEIRELEKIGGSADRLLIALNARLVLPQHIALDRLRESQGQGKIGTTGRGIGPVYADHVSRLGLTMNDLLNPDVFARKLKRNLAEKLQLLMLYDEATVRAVMQQPILGAGAYYHPTRILDADAIIERYLAYGRELRQFITDTDAILREAQGKQRILLSGTQGNLLSIDYGTYPYVTSSDCSIMGLAKGVGLRERHVDLALGIVKAFYMTRVGEGPFPTELGGELSADHCREATRDSEARMSTANLNAETEFLKGVAIRQAGNEYGATTGRPRRTGWLDGPLIRYSAGQLTGPNVILTKLDVLDGMREVKFCTAYEYLGPPYQYGTRTLKPGDEITVAIPDPEIMRHCRPRYEVLEGWPGPIRYAEAYDDLPAQLRQAITYLEQTTGVNVTLLSVGPDREETIFVKDPVR